MTDEIHSPAEDLDDPAVPRQRDWRRVVAFCVLPATAVLLGAGAGFLRWQDSAQRAAETAAVDSVTAARDTTVAMLSYRSDTVEQDLMGVRDRLTGPFVDSFTDLVKTVVIPGSKEKKISAAATVKAAASVSATARHAVALLFVDTAVTVGTGKPSATLSGVRVSLDKVGERWLVSGFDPV